MKKRSILAALSVCLFLLASCNHPPKAESENGSAADHPVDSAAAATEKAISPAISDPSAVTDGELEANFSEFTASIAALRADSMQSVALSITTPSGTENHASSDARLIAEWVTLLQKMKFVSKPFAPVGGIGFHLGFTSADGKDISVAGFVDQYVYTSSDRTMLVIANFDALSDAITALVNQLKSMG